MSTATHAHDHDHAALLSSELDALDFSLEVSRASPICVVRDLACLAHAA